jgi:hypothetical protein
MGMLWQPLGKGKGTENEMGHLGSTRVGGRGGLLQACEA